tara:strand:+ start:23 stop:865 length:843 start_codon:yes stop_codon:yes gene_type:complete
MSTVHVGIVTLGNCVSPRSPLISLPVLDGKGDMARDNMPVHYSASDYDRYTTDAVATYDDGLMKRLLQEYRMMGRGQRVLLDVGTGTARLLLKIAARSEFEDIQLIGTDFFEDMVKQARETVTKAGLTERIAVEQSDVHAMPQSDEFADLIVSRSTIHHWADPPQAFREIFRLLKPGGVAIIHEPRRDPAPEAIAEFNRRRSELGIEDARMDEKYTTDEVREFVRQSGLNSNAMVLAPERGPGALGMEVRISKAGWFRRTLVRFVGWLGMSPLKNPWDSR